MAEALDYAIDREQRDLGVGIFQEREAGFRAADFGDGRGQRARQHHAAGDRHLRLRVAGGDQVDQIVLQEKRRMREHGDGDLGLVAGQRMHHHARRLLRGGEDFGERAPHQRRRIVEQHDHRAFGGGQIVGRKIGMQVSARQRGGCFGPVTGRRITDPLQELTDYHDFTDATTNRLASTATQRLAEEA